MEINKIKSKTKFFFDLDNTLSRSRSLMSPEMASALKKLSGKYTIIVVSGAQKSQMEKQIETGFKYYLLSQNGNWAIDEEGQTLWKHEFSQKEKDIVMNNIDQILGSRKREDLVEDRGCQISLSMIGHNAPIGLKEKYDPDGQKRKNILKEFSLDSDLIEVRVGGTTCLDYTQKGKNKGTNLAKLVRLNNWKMEECIYLGDRLHKGGNDETVVGVCDTHSVDSPLDTLEFIKTIFK